jgi:hypothetical protein
MSYYRKVTSECSLLASAAVTDGQLGLENGKLNAILKLEVFG